MEVLNRRLAEQRREEIAPGNSGGSAGIRKWKVSGGHSRRINNGNFIVKRPLAIVLRPHRSGSIQKLAGQIDPNIVVLIFDRQPCRYSLNTVT